MSCTTAESNALLSYREHQCTFQPDAHFVDEKVIDHDHHIKPHFSQRLKVSHRDAGNLSLLANLTRVQYGFFKNDPACLVGFRFQFQRSSHNLLHSWRFEKADVRIEFQAHPASDDPREDPVVVEYGPKHLASDGTNEKRDWWYSANLSARSDLVTIAPSVSTGFGGSYEKHTAVSIEGADYSDHQHTDPTIVKYWLREDERQKSRVPLDFHCAVIVVHGSPAFQATVDVKVGPVFDLLASPWKSDDPVLFEMGIEYGEAVREGQMVDFATLTQEEWRKLVTPDLKFKETLGNNPSNGD